MHYDWPPNVPARLLRSAPYARTWHAIGHQERIEVVRVGDGDEWIIRAVTNDVIVPLLPEIGGPVHLQRALRGLLFA